MSLRFFPGALSISYSVEMCGVTLTKVPLREAVLAFGHHVAVEFSPPMFLHIPYLGCSDLPLCTLRIRHKLHHRYLIMFYIWFKAVGWH